MGPMTGTVFRVERFAIHDGPGIRTTVFLKGCPLRCAWCHSPESQSPRPEFMPLPDRCIGCGSCVAACPHRRFTPPGVRSENVGFFTADPGVSREKSDIFRPDPRGVKEAALSDLTPEGCTRCGACVEACPTGARVLVGEEMSVEDVVAAVERDRLFYDESGGGVTFSGGEPLMQAGFLGALVEACRERAIHVAVDTSGFGDPRVLDDIRPDLFLFDVKAIDERLHREITGVSNRGILENLACLAKRRVGRSEGPKVRGSEGLFERPSDRRTSGLSDVIVRFPFVPGVNDADGNVRAIGRTVSSLGIARVDLLPYHRAGLAKYARLGKAYPLPETQPPTPEEIGSAARILAEAGLDVRVGG